MRGTMSNIDSKVYEIQSSYTHHEHSEQWGQPPASHYVFSVEGGVIHGYLISVMPTSSSPASAKSYTLSNLTSGYDYFLIESPEPNLGIELEVWDNLSDETLAALYEEAAEEDQLLAQLGLAHYAEILRQEEEAE
jgi:hypothetical protein